MDQLQVERFTQSKTVLQNLIGVGCISLKLFGRSVSLKAVFFYFQSWWRRKRCKMQKVPVFRSNIRKVEGKEID